MIVFGAGGLTIQILDMLLGLHDETILVFSDKPTAKPKISEFLHVSNEIKDLETQLRQTDSKFIISHAGPQHREDSYNRLTSLGGTGLSLLSPKSDISQGAVISGDSVIILHDAIIEQMVTVGKGCLINCKVFIGHESTIGNFTEIAPGAILNGNVVVGERCFIGSGAVILPGVNLGDGCTVGAGAVVLSDVEPATTVIGVPAKKVIK
ncbi:MAG: acetyltransferase [Bacteroidetes bacterium]|nr:acetyltransferase [Bacteroidota bacterium]